MINIKKLNKLIGNPDEMYKVNKTLVKTIGAEEALLYTFLLTVYFEKNHILYNNESYFLCPVEMIQQNLGFSSFKQRNILGSLAKYKLIKIKLGQARARYISINEDLSILESLLYEEKYQYYQTILINKFIKNIEELKENEKLNYEDSLHFYNFVSHFNFDRGIKQSDEFKNLSTYIIETNSSSDINNKSSNVIEEALIK